MNTGLELIVLTIAVCTSCISAHDVVWINDTTMDTNTFSRYYETAPVTWQEAYQSCSNKGMSLASVLSKELSDRLAAWLVDLEWEIRTGRTFDPAIWTSGRRSNDVTWQTQDGEIANPNIADGAINGNCAQWKNIDGFSSGNCTSRGNCAYCEYSMHEGGCSPGDLLKHERCHHASDDVMTWFEASNYCRDIPGGSLVTVPWTPNDSSSSDFLDGTYWTGFIRRPWEWNRHTGNIGMDFYGFQRYEGSVETGSGSCLQITWPRLNWVDASCDNRVHYYLCENDAFAATVPGPMSYPVGFTSEGPVLAEAGTSLIVIVTSAVVAVAVALGTIAAGLFFYCRQKKKTPPPLPSRIPIGFPYDVSTSSLSPPQRLAPVLPIPTCVHYDESPYSVITGKGQPNIIKDAGQPNKDAGSQKNHYDTAAHVGVNTGSNDVISNTITPYATTAKSVYSLVGDVTTSSDVSSSDVKLPGNAESSSDNCTGDFNHIIAPNGDVYTKPIKKH